MLALGLVGIGSLPGEDAPGAKIVGGVALVAMAAGALRSPARPSIVLAPAAALFLLAFVCTYDPYFAPSKRRYLDGVVPLSYALGLLGLSLAVALLTWYLRRAGGVATSLFLAVVLVSFLFAGDGH